MSDEGRQPYDGGAAQSWLRALLPGFAFALPFSIALAQFCAFTALAVWFYDLMRRREPRRPHNPYLVPVLLFAIVAIVASAFGVRPEISIPKLHRLLLFLLIFAIPSVRPRAEETPLAFPALLAGALIAGATARAVYDAFAIPLALLRAPGDVSSSFWLFSQGSMVTPQFYLVALCFLLAAARSPWRARHPGLFPALLALNALGMILHFKRGVWFSFAGAVVVLVLMAPRRARTLLILAGCAALATALPPVQARLRAIKAEWSGMKGGRMELWTKAAPRLIERFHARGMGLGAMTNQNLRRYVREIEPKINHLHNNFLQILVELGWAGAAVWTVWMGLALGLLGRAVWKFRGAAGPAAWLAPGALAAFCGLLLNGLVEYNFGTGVILMLFSLLMGLSVCLIYAPSPAGGRTI